MIEFSNFLEDNKVKLSNFDEPWEKIVPKNVGGVKIFE